MTRKLLGVIIIILGFIGAARSYNAAASTAERLGNFAGLALFIWVGLRVMSNTPGKS